MQYGTMMKVTKAGADRKADRVMSRAGRECGGSHRGAYVGVGSGKGEGVRGIPAFSLSPSARRRGRITSPCCRLIIGDPERSPRYCRGLQGRGNTGKRNGGFYADHSGCATRVTGSVQCCWYWVNLIGGAMIQLMNLWRTFPFGCRGMDRHVPRHVRYPDTSVRVALFRCWQEFQDCHV